MPAPISYYKKKEKEEPKQSLTFTFGTDYSLRGKTQILTSAESQKIIESLVNRTSDLVFWIEKKGQERKTFTGTGIFAWRGTRFGDKNELREEIGAGAEVEICPKNFPALYAEFVGWTNGSLEFKGGWKTYLDRNKREFLSTALGKSGNNLTVSVDYLVSILPDIRLKLGIRKEYGKGVEAVYGGAGLFVTF